MIFWTSSWKESPTKGFSCFINTFGFSKLDKYFYNCFGHGVIGLFFLINNNFFGSFQTATQLGLRETPRHGDAVETRYTESWVHLVILATLGQFERRSQRQHWDALTVSGQDWPYLTSTMTHRLWGKDDTEAPKTFFRFILHFWDCDAMKNNEERILGRLSVKISRFNVCYLCKIGSVPTSDRQGVSISCSNVATNVSVLQISTRKLTVECDLYRSSHRYAVSMT